MGRPTKAEPRSKQLNLSLTPSEYERVRERADAVGMRPVHFGRALVLNEGKAGVKNAAPNNQLTRLIYTQLGRIGNNLNQLVRYIHTYGGSPPPELEQVLRDIRRIISGEAAK